MNTNHLRPPFPLPPDFRENVGCLPWTQRRVSLAQKIASRGDGGLPVNIRYTLKTNTNEPESKDLRRFLDEGYAQISQKSGGVHRAGRRVGKQHKTVQLTTKGLLLLEA